MAGQRRRSALAAARRAAGFTQEQLAEALSVDRSTVIRWEAGDNTPLPYVWPKLAQVLGQSQHQLQRMIYREGDSVPGQPVRLLSDIDPAFAWLDEHAHWSTGTSRLRVASSMATLDRQGIAVKVDRRARIGRVELADALSRYYPGDETYRARYGGLSLSTTIACRPGWLDLRCALTPETDQVRLTRHLPSRVRLDDHFADRAVDRLAEAAFHDVRLTDQPIYRLLTVDPGPRAIAGTVGLVSFTDYALTADLLERELMDALAAGSRAMPLRDQHLPDLAAVFDVGSRLCAGGVLALCAIARPADPYRGEADYLLLVQERSGHVLNAARKLAVIPKGFHAPLADFRGDARIRATLERELEEELFGRKDVDNTVGGQRAAAPMHPGRLSAPMRWLTEAPGRLLMECTGFGLNLVSGNYEFACLVVIDDEEFWPRFGGDIEANWEANRLRQYSSLDADLIADLVADESWSNEGLFAFLQGLRRLQESGGKRVTLPAIVQG